VAISWIATLTGHRDGARGGRISHRSASQPRLAVRTVTFKHVIKHELAHADTDFAAMSLRSAIPVGKSLILMKSIWCCARVAAV